MYIGTKDDIKKTAGSIAMNIIIAQDNVSIYYGFDVLKTKIKIVSKKSTIGNLRAAREAWENTSERLIASHKSSVGKKTRLTYAIREMKKIKQFLDAMSSHVN